MKLFGYKLVVDLNYSVVTQIVSVALAVQLVRFCYLIFRSYKLSKTERQSAAGDANDKKKKGTRRARPLLRRKRFGRAGPISKRACV